MTKEVSENIVGVKEKLPIASILSFLYTRRRWDVLCDHPWRAVSPILCPEHISKTMLATVMKFHGWIDLIKADCSVQEP